MIIVWNLLLDNWFLLSLLIIIISYYYLVAIKFTNC